MVAFALGILLGFVGSIPAAGPLLLLVIASGLEGQRRRALALAAGGALAESLYVALAFWWAKAVAAADAGNHPADFRTAKRETARFYFARILPRTQTHAAAMRSGSGNLLALDAALFDS